MNRSSNVWQVVPGDILFVIASGVAMSPSWNIKPIIRLSQVCLHWRRVLLSFPSLWTTIHMVLPCPSTFWKELLNRSADYALNIELVIRISSSHSTLPWTLERCGYLPSVVDRIRTIAIEVEGFITNPQDHLDCVLSLFERPAPMLKTFIINSCGGQLPKKFLDIAPNLEALDIRRMSLSYQMPILRRVTTLCLREIFNSPSVDQLLSILEDASDKLEVLVLDFFGPISDSGDVRLFDGLHHDIHLNHLQLLCLDLQPYTLMEVLNRIKTPSDVVWTIDCSNALCQSNLDTSPLLSFLKNLRPASRVLFNLLSDRCIHINFAPDSSSDYCMSLGAEVSETPHGIRQFEAVLSNLDLSQLDSFEIDAKWPDKEDVFIESYCDMFGSLFLPFHRLETLIIRSRYSQAFHQFINQLKPAATLPCPLLTHMLIDWDDIDDNVEKLSQVLMDRKKAGHVLKELRVDIPSNNDISTLDMLEKFVEKLIVNVY